MGLGASERKIRNSGYGACIRGRCLFAKLTSLEVPGEPKWTNLSSEGLIRFLEVSGRQIPITWELDRNASETGTKRVGFVYESARPHLRLTWE